MSSSSTKARPRKQQGKTAGKQGGDAVPLIIPVPGGQARFYSQAELTPRRTRALDVMLTHLGPRMQELAAAQQVTAANGDTVADPVRPGPAAYISEDEAEKFNELNDIAAWVYLKSWTVDRQLPADVDEILDLPTPLYRAIVNHAAKLVAATVYADQFTVDALPDDPDEEADPDLPT